MFGLKKKGNMARCNVFFVLLFFFFNSRLNYFIPEASPLVAGEEILSNSIQRIGEQNRPPFPATKPGVKIFGDQALV